MAADPSKTVVMLLVEDDKLIRTMIKDFFKLNAYEFIEADDGQQALALALQHHPQVIVADLMLPKMSGAQMIRELRKHIDFATTPIVAITAGTEELRDEAKKAGAHLVLTKPLKPSEVVYHVENLLASTPFIKK